MKLVQETVLFLFISGLNLFQAIDCEQLERDVVLDNDSLDVYPVIYLHGGVKDWIEQSDSWNRRLSMKNIDPNKSLEVLKKYAEKEKSKAKQQMGILMKVFKPKKVKIEPQNFLNFVKRLDELAKSCDYESYKALSAIYTVLIGREQTLRDDKPLNLILLNALEEHGNNCRPSYLIKFKKINLQKKAVEEIDSLIDNEFLDRFIGSDRDANSVLRLKDSALRIEKLSSYVMDKLSDSSKGYPDHDEKHLSHPGAVRSIREIAYLDEYCEAFMGPLKEIFYPAKLDLILDPGKIDSINPDKDEEFMRAWTKFHICGVLLLNKQDLINMYHSRLKYGAKNQSKIESVDQ